MVVNGFPQGALQPWLLIVDLVPSLDCDFTEGQGCTCSYLYLTTYQRACHTVGRWAERTDSTDQVIKCQRLPCKSNSGAALQSGCALIRVKGQRDSLITGESCGVFLSVRFCLQTNKLSFSGNYG